jgi:hypothetical protein
MPQINITNFEDTEVSGSYMLLDPGVYQFNCMTEPVMSTTKNGYTQLEFEFTVLEGPEQKVEFGPGGKSPVGRTLKDWVVIIPTTPDKKSARCHGNHHS